MYEITAKADSAREGNCFGAPGKHRLGTLVKRETLQVAHAQLPADLIGALQHRDANRVAALARHEPRCRQARDATAYDDDVRALDHEANFSRS